MSINAQPFQPQFKLIGNLAEDQVLVYDTSEGAFVNSTASGGGGASGYDAVANIGTGSALYYGDAGTTLQLKTIIGGDNITITDNGSGGLILAATNTDTIQDGTNLGTGTGIFDSKDGTTHALKFKSLAVGAGLTLTDDGAGTLTLVNTIAAGTTDADLTLSNLSDNATARTNLGVYSKTETDARYHRTDANFLPSQNNVYDVGSPAYKFNDIYAETFQGTAVLADQLTISGTSGQVLTHNGSEWVAGAGNSVLSSASDMSNVAPADNQHLVWDANTNLWTPSSAGEGMGGGGYGDSNARGAISVSGDLSYNSSTGVISFTQNDAWSNITGTPTTLAGYGITAIGSITDHTDVDTTGITSGQILKWNGTHFVPSTDSGGVTASSTDTFTNKSGAISQWTNDSNYLTSVPAQSFASLTGKPTTIAGFGITDAFDGDYTNLTNKPNLFDGTYSSLSGKPTLFSGSYNDLSAKPTLFDGAYSSLSGRPTLFDGAYSSLTGKPTTLAGYGITDSFDNADIDAHLNTGTATANQVLKWTGTDYDWVTSTDSDTTYTAGTGLTLTGTEFSLTGGTVTASSSTAFTNKTGNISQWTNDAGYLTSETDSQTLSLSGTTLSISTGNNVDLGALTLDDFADVTISSVSDGQFLTYNNSSGDWTNSTVTIPTLTSQLTNDAGFITSASTYDNSDVDSHLNQSNPTSGYVLSWNGSDYAWVSNGASGAHYTDSDARAAFSATTGLSYNSGTGVFSLNAQLENLSDVSSTTPSTGEVLKWNGSAWTPSADLDTDTVYTTFNSDFDTRLAAKSTTDVSEGSNKYFTDARARQAISASGDLSYNASTGVISYTAPTMYANSDVDTHLNKASATTGQILSWNGSDYDWIANAGTPAWSSITGKPTTISGFGITDAFDGAYSSLTGTPTIPTNNNQLTNGAGYLVSSDLSGYAQTSSLANVATTGNFSALTSKPTTIAGYGITDAFANLVEDTSPQLGADLDLQTHNITTSATDFDIQVGSGSNITTIALGGATGTGYSLEGAAIVSSTSGGQDIVLLGDFNFTSGLTTGEFIGMQSFDYTTSKMSLMGLTTVTENSSNYVAQTMISDQPTIIMSNVGGSNEVSLAIGSGSDNRIHQLNSSGGTIFKFPAADGTASQVLTTDGSGDLSWTTVSGGGGGATDKIEEGNSSVEVIDGGANGHVMFNTNGSDRWQVSNSGHILPEADATYDIGSATNKVRHLFLSNSSLYLGTDTLRTNSSNLLFNGDDVQDYSNLKNKPATTSAGTGIQINSGVVSLNSALSGLSDVHTTAPTDGQVLAWDNGNSRWAPAPAGGSLAMNNLTDVDTSGISTGQYLKWDGSKFVASTVSGGGASAINDLSDVDTNTSAPSNGDVLTWSASGSEWAPQAPSGGGGGGASVEYFKVNYATNGNLSSITNATSGVSATILSTTGGDVEISFSGASYPPASILIYGYAYTSNEYVIMPFNTDMTTRKIDAGGSSGSPTAFGSFSSTDMTLKLRENDTGASRSFGTTTHAWIMFTLA
jgi:hypothetical protein